MSEWRIPVPKGEPWAVYDKRGRLLWLDIAEDEARVWTIYLGWPDAEEIEDAKRQGLYALPVLVSQKKAA